jgi:hypothetical protein
MRLRSQLALSGGLGVTGGALLMGGALFLLRGLNGEALIDGLGAWALLAFLLFFSLVEIPLMIWGMRRMVGSPSGRRLASLTTAAFTFFAAVYALPYLLLTGRAGVGLALAALSLVRWAGAVWLVPGGQMGAREPGSGGDI